MAYPPASVTLPAVTDPLGPHLPAPREINAQCRAAYPHLADYSALQECEPHLDDDEAPEPEPEELE